jgi:8-oxo-dGTP pyrophosphatase MutT (NUDIX family)
MYDEDELLDLFDKDEKVVGTVERGDYYKNPEKYKDRYLRSAEMFIRNDKGELWIPRRHINKKIAPGGLDYSCGGHIGAGENYIEGLIREAEEELQLTLRPEDVQLLRMFTPNTENRWFRAVFVYESNITPKYNKHDFSEYYWIKPAELLQKLEAGEPAKSSMLETVQTLRTVF